MKKSIIELTIGSLSEKRAWRQSMKRVAALPSDYRYAYKKIMNYGYGHGFCCVTQTDLLELFEQSAADGKTVTQVIGADAAAFCDELILACRGKAESAGERLNAEIMQYFQAEGKL